jgi:hypothetical protein
MPASPAYELRLSQASQPSRALRLGGHSKPRRRYRGRIDELADRGGKLLGLFVVKVVAATFEATRRQRGRTNFLQRYMIIIPRNFSPFAAGSAPRRDARTGAAAHRFYR